MLAKINPTSFATPNFLKTQNSLLSKNKFISGKPMVPAQLTALQEFMSKQSLQSNYRGKSESKAASPDT